MQINHLQQNKVFFLSFCPEIDGGKKKGEKQNIYCGCWDGGGGAGSVSLSKLKMMVVGD